jgi:polyhydroxyalkanoate synthesis regulator protein
MAITPAFLNQQGEVRSTSSITSTLDGTVESRISLLESGVEQTNRMMQDMMKMMERFTKQEAQATSEGEQATEVAMTGDQYNNKSPHGEAQE